jgi:hypothetical protein
VYEVIVIVTGPAGFTPEGGTMALTAGGQA